MDVSSNLKKLDRQKLLGTLQSKQELAAERVQAGERDQEQSWKIFNEEEHHRKLERQKKLQRNTRKIELKKEAVVRKQQKNEVQVHQRKTQQELAIQLKRDLNAQMVGERENVKTTIGVIDTLSIQNVDKVLAKTSDDSPSPKKSRLYRSLVTTSDYAANH